VGNGRHRLVGCGIGPDAAAQYPQLVRQKVGMLTGKHREQLVGRMAFTVAALAGRYSLTHGRSLRIVGG
jgi:hypothetical protein